MRPRILLLITLLLAALVLGLGVRWATDRVGARLGAEVVPEEERMPEGRWHRTRLPGVEDSAERARALSLPYLAGRLEAPDAYGVRTHDRDRAYQGVNLYVSGHGPEAILMNMDGETLHRWRLSFEAAFPGREPSASTGFFRRAWLLPDGDLLVLYQEGGVARLASDSTPRWTLSLPAYNHLFVDHQETLWTLTKRAVERPEIRKPGVILEDSLVRASLEGEVHEEISLLDAMRRSRFAHLLEPLPSHEDIFHSNTVIVFDARLAHHGELFREGNVLFSLRDVDTIGILDPVGREVLWARRGPWKRQHQPLPLDRGTLLLFDNRGFHGRARVLELDPAEGSVVWQFPPEDGEPLHSPQGGSIQVLPNGNLLITESESGRAIEIDGTGEVVWELLSPHRAGRHDELVATLWEVQRLEAEAAAPVLASSASEGS